MTRPEPRTLEEILRTRALVVQAGLREADRDVEHALRADASDELVLALRRRESALEATEEYLLTLLRAGLRPASHAALVREMRVELEASQRRQHALESWLLRSRLDVERMLDAPHRPLASTAVRGRYRGGDAPPRGLSALG